MTLVLCQSGKSRSRLRNFFRITFIFFKCVEALFCILGMHIIIYKEKSFCKLNFDFLLVKLYRDHEVFVAESILHSFAYTHTDSTYYISLRFICVLCTYFRNFRSGFEGSSEILHGFLSTHIRQCQRH